MKINITQALLYLKIRKELEKQGKYVTQQDIIEYIKNHQV